jgi:hypothetical protein
MIEARGLVKRYGSTMAVNGLSFSIRPGMVTGFLKVQPDEPPSTRSARARRNPIATLEMGRTGRVRTMVREGDLAVDRLPIAEFAS